MDRKNPLFCKSVGRLLYKNPQISTHRLNTSLPVIMYLGPCSRARSIAYSISYIYIRLSRLILIDTYVLFNMWKPKPVSFFPNCVALPASSLKIGWQKPDSLVLSSLPKGRFVFRIQLSHVSLTENIENFHHEVLTLTLVAKDSLLSYNLAIW